VILLIVVIQQFESNVLGPRVIGRAVGLHPLGALFALLVGFEVAGILGGPFAVPIAGVLWVLVSATYRHFVASEPVTEITTNVALPRAIRNRPTTGLRRGDGHRCPRRSEHALQALWLRSPTPSQSGAPLARPRSSRAHSSSIRAGGRRSTLHSACRHRPEPDRQRKPRTIDPDLGRQVATAQIYAHQSGGYHQSATVAIGARARLCLPEQRVH
jgi:hypothetical protein